MTINAPDTPEAKKLLANIHDYCSGCDYYHIFSDKLNVCLVDYRRTNPDTSESRAHIIDARTLSVCKLKQLRSFNFR